MCLPPATDENEMKLNSVGEAHFRGWAFIIDGLVLYFLFLIIMFSGLDFPLYTFDIVLFMYFVIILWWFGATPGKWLTKLRLVDKGGSRANLFQVFIRQLPLLLLTLPFNFIGRLHQSHMHEELRAAHGDDIMCGLPAVALFFGHVFIASLYIIDPVSMFSNENRRRFSDVFARTKVVSTRINSLSLASSLAGLSNDRSLALEDDNEV